MSDDYIDRIERFLERHGIEQYQFRKRSKRRSVVISHGGRQVTVFFPKTSCNWEGPANALRNLRHALGLVGKRAA
jgi:hypothetical protein